MAQRETVNFFFPSVLMFLETKSRETSGLEEKNPTKYFPEGPYIKCFVIYLDFPLKIIKQNST